MSEIATWSMIRSKIPSFPAPTSGHDNECLTKSEMLAKGGIRVNGSYNDNECVMLGDIEKYVVTLEYEFSADELIMVPENFQEYRINIHSYNYRYENGVLVTTTKLPWIFLNYQEEVISADGEFSIMIIREDNYEGSYIDVRLNSYPSKENLITINLIQYISNKALNLKIFYGEKY